MSKRRLLSFALALILAFLLLPIGAFAAYTPPATFKVTINGQTIKDTDVSALTSYDYTATTTKGGVSTTTYYRGYRLSDIFNLVGASYDNGFIALAGSYKMEYASTDMLDNTILAAEKSSDGTTYSDTDCPVLAPCSKTEGKYFVKGVTSINELFPSFSVVVGDKTITNADLKTYDVYSLTGTTTKGTTAYKGYKLSDVLTAAGITAYEDGVKVESSDTTSFTYSKDVISKSTTLLAILKKGSTDTAFIATTCPILAPCDSSVGKEYRQSVTKISAVAAATTTTTPATTTATTAAITNPSVALATATTAAATTPKTNDTSYIAPSIIFVMASSLMVALIEIRKNKIKE